MKLVIEVEDGFGGGHLVYARVTNDGNLIISAIPVSKENELREV